jgi:hypothetical protein
MTLFGANGIDPLGAKFKLVLQDHLYRERS